MTWWNDFVDWTASDTGSRLITGAIIPFVAIVVAGIVAALIGRGATKRVIGLQEREAKNAAVAGIVSAARKAATWGSLTHDERAYADHLAEDADIRLRLLPVPGAPLAANWAQHEIADIKKHSSTFSFQAEQSLAEFRDRMLDWQARPARARKLFKNDLERWKFESPDPDSELIQRQQQWNADQADKRADPSPATTALRPADAGRSATAASGDGQAIATRVQPDIRPTLGGTPAQGDAPYGTARSGSATTAPGMTSAAAATPTAVAPTTASSTAGVRSTSGSAAAPVAEPAPRPAWTTNTSAARRDDDATRPIGDDRATTPIADDRATTPYGDRAVTPPLAGRGSASLQGDHDADDDARPSELTSPKVDAAATTNTTSIPTRFGDAPAEPADAHETDEAPYTQPISASELRRRSDDDDD